MWLRSLQKWHVWRSAPELVQIRNGCVPPDQNLPLPPGDVKCLALRVFHSPTAIKKYQIDLFDQISDLRISSGGRE